MGCGKGYLLYEIKKVLPQIQISGFDISKYAIKNSKKEIKKYLSVKDIRKKLKYKKKSFDLVMSLGLFHNLNLYEIEQSIKQINRIAKRSFIMVESYRNEKELFNLQCWALTCESFFTPSEWKYIFKKIYTKVILNLSIFNFQRLKNIFSNIFNKILFIIGYDVNFRQISKFEIQAKKFNTLKKQNKIVDYVDQKKYFNKIKDLPGPKMFKEWEEIIIEWENCNPKVFQKLENYYSIRQKNLIDVGLSKFEVDFIRKDIFTGSFGMPFHFQVYHESKNLNFHKAETISLIDKIFFSNSNKWSITNQTLFNYVKPFLI